MPNWITSHPKFSSTAASYPSLQNGQKRRMWIVICQKKNLLITSIKFRPLKSASRILRPTQPREGITRFDRELIEKLRNTITSDIFNRLGLRPQYKQHSERSRNETCPSYISFNGTAPGHAPKTTTTPTKDWQLLWAGFSWERVKPQIAAATTKTAPSTFLCDGGCHQ